jgi:hypothetical protein
MLANILSWVSYPLQRECEIDWQLDLQRHSLPMEWTPWDRHWQWFHLHHSPRILSKVIPHQSHQNQQLQLSSKWHHQISTLRHLTVPLQSCWQQWNRMVIGSTLCILGRIYHSLKTFRMLTILHSHQNTPPYPPWLLRSDFPPTSPNVDLVDNRPSVQM